MAKRREHLTLKERAFLIAWVSGMTATDAYLATLPPGGPPPASRHSAAELGSRMIKRLRKNAPVDFKQLLEEAGLGDLRLARELHLRLTAEETKFYQDQNLGNFEDNGTRMQATTLLADVLGKRKGQLEIAKLPELVVRFEPPAAPTPAGPAPAEGSRE